MGHAKKVELTTVPKKLVYIRLPFKGDNFSIIYKKKLKYTIEKVYNAATFIFIERTKPIQVRKSPVLVNDHVTSHCVYKFKCSCGYNYIGRTDRSLKTRVSEHIPKWLNEAMDETDYPNNLCDRRPASSIAKHLIESGHKVNTGEAFNVLFKSNKGKLLRFIEALAIKKFNPDLCIQKQFILTLQLPW